MTSVRARFYRLPGHFRVETRDGRQLHCESVVFDPEHRAVRLQAHGQAEHTLAVTEIDGISARTVRLLRAAALTLGATVIGAGIGGLLGRWLTLLAQQDGMIIGVTLGALVGGVIAWLLRDQPWLWYWHDVYSKPAA